MVTGRARGWIGIGCGVALLLGGCIRGDGGEAREEALGTRARRAERELAVDTERVLAAARERLVAHSDSVRSRLRAVPALSRREQGELRRDVNAEQVSTARALGVRAAAESRIRELVQQGRLVPLEDSTAFWVLDDLDFSVPFVTPDTRAMLIDLGERFHARLDSLGVPRFRMVVTSVLRTPSTQASLRRLNSNAAAGPSAHEFGTTVDISHIRFAAPRESVLRGMPGAPAELAAQMAYVEALVMEEAARRHSEALRAELGRALLEMRRDGALRVMMERRQAVYHMTVSRRFAARSLAE